MPVSLKTDARESSIRRRTGGSPVRDKIAAGTPSMLQPFLTWLTACPIDGETHIECYSTDCVKYSLIRIFSGFLSYVLSCMSTGLTNHILYLFSVILLTGAFGLLQVGVFHYCSHGTVFKSWKANAAVGRLVSAVCLFPSFDHYRSKHMRHHSHEVLLTDEDEFTEFVINQCGLIPGLSKRYLWIKVIASIVSPWFHFKFFIMRFLSATEHLRTQKGMIVLVGWLIIILVVVKTGNSYDFILFFIVPLTIPFQVTVIIRTLCEHHVPDDQMGIVRDRSLSNHATRPVFAGCNPPSSCLKGFSKTAAWTLWWVKMMTFHLLFRVIVLVGDAARHDLHHARPGDRNWANYMCDRYPARRPAETSCSNESWGCFSTINKCILSISSSTIQTETALFI